MSDENNQLGIQIDDQSRDLKRFLWGANNNKKKILKLAEAAIETLKKASESLNQQRKDDYSEKQKKFIEREIENIEKIKKIITEKSNPWPEAEKPTIKTQKDEKKTRTETSRKEAGRILLIDDDAIILKSISYFLIREDFLVNFALNAEEGLKKALSESPDLILLDIMMPGMDGYQFLKQLKSRKDTSNIPVIILSSLSRESDMLKGLENGADDYITKPFSPQVLISKMKKILGSNKCK